MMIPSNSSTPSCRISTKNIKKTNKISGKTSHNKHRDQIMCAQMMASRQKQYYESMIAQLNINLSLKTQKLYQAQNHLKQFKTSLLSNINRDLHQLTQSLQQKQAIIHTLNRQIHRQQNKIMNLEETVSNLASSKQVLQQTYIKILQHLKSQVKQISSYSKQNQLDSLVTQNQQKKLMNTFNQMGKMYSDIDLTKIKLQDKMNRLRRQNAQLIDYNLSLQTQLSIQKQITRKQNSHKNNQRQTTSSQAQFFYQESQNLPYLQALKSQQTNFLKKIDQQLSQLILQKRQYSTQTNAKILQIKSQLQQKEQVFLYCQRLQQENEELKTDLNKIKQISHPYLADQLLKQSQPQLYEFFKQKMHQIQKFQSRLERLEQVYEAILNEIETIAIEGVPEFKIKQTQQQKREKERIIRSKVKKQLKKQLEEKIRYQQFMNEKQEIFESKMRQKNKIIEELQQKIQNIKNQNNLLMNDNKALKILSDGLQSRLQEMKNRINQKQQFKNNVSQEQDYKQVIKVQKQSYQTLSSQYQSIYDDQSNQNRTLSPVKNSKQAKNEQYISFLQKQNSSLREDNQHFSSLIVQYKKQIKFVLENYKIKSTQLKSKHPRCCQCYLLITDYLDEKQQRIDIKKCLNCKLEFHNSRQCYSNHIAICKVKQPPVPKDNNVNNRKRITNINKRRNTKNKTAFDADSLYEIPYLNDVGSADENPFFE